MTVYVVQNQRKLDTKTGEFVSRFDLGPAEKFGKIEFILSPTAKPFMEGLSDANEAIIDEINQKLSIFGSDDYLLLIGNPALIGLVVAVAACHNEGNVKLLQWNREKGGYYAEISAENIFRDIQQ
jgi:hypothetical protein